MVPQDSGRTNRTATGLLRDHIEYVEICKTIKKKAKEDIRKHNLDEIRETIAASKSLKKVRRTHSLGKNRMITLLDKQGKEIQEQDKTMERIEEFYSELYDSDQAVTIQTDPKEVPPIMAWEVEEPGHTGVIISVKGPPTI